MASETQNTATKAFITGLIIGLIIGGVVTYLVLVEKPQKPPTPTHVPDSLPDSTSTVFIDQERNVFEMCIPISCELVRDICDGLTAGDIISYEIVEIETSTENDGLRYNMEFNEIEYSETSQVKACLDESGENLILCFAAEYEPESLPIGLETLSCNYINEIIIDSVNPLVISMKITSSECPEGFEDSW